VTWEELGNELKINNGTLRNYVSQLSAIKKAQYIPLQTLLEISDFLKIPYSEVEKLVTNTKYGKNGKPMQISFPINFMDTEWAGLVGALLAEGYINKDFGVGFWNTDDEVISNFLEMTNKIISNGVRVNKKVYGCFFPAIFGRILTSGLGFGAGDKTKINIGIPLIYKNSVNEELIKSLLSWLFTGDGWVTVFKDHLGQTHRTVGIGFGSSRKNKIPRLLEDTLKLLKALNINYSRPLQEIKEKKDGSPSYFWKIFIKGKENLVNFKKRIGFRSSVKERILNMAIESYTMPKLRNGESLYLLSDAIQKICRNSLATKHEIAKITGLKTDRIESLLKEAKEKNLIKVVGGGGKNPTGGRFPYVYEPTGNCLEFIRKGRCKFL